MNDEIKTEDLNKKIADLELQLSNQIKISNALKQRVKQNLQLSDNSYTRFETNILLQKEIEKQTYDLQIAREIAESANHTKSEFLSNMSHEMRTPLHAILGFAEMGEKKSDFADREKLSAYFEHIQASGKRLLHLLNDLLDLAKFESGELQMNFHNSDIFASIERIIIQHQTLIEFKNLNIELVKKDFPILAYIDIARIDQVIINLLSNAIKFTAINSTIKIDFKKARNAISAPVIEISISDEGIGIPATEKKLIFEKFIQSSKTTTGDGGTGLGLAICQQIVQRHLGEIWAENNEGPGATFFFTVPVAHFPGEK